MRFFTKSRYALRVMADIASRPQGVNVSLKALSESQHISLKYLEQIIVPLSRAGLLVSERGSQGGYRLAVSPEECTAGDVLRAIEGSLAPVDCLTPDGRSCDRRDRCPTISFWKGLGACVENYADGVPLSRLVSGCVETPESE
ncbi:MAG: Rrf2 family transcriptional regulator [Mailhella sp.]|nr:Rrf2 family transcriptional regulator [Mailhella sp.]